MSIFDDDIVERISIIPEKMHIIDYWMAWKYVFTKAFEKFENKDITPIQLSMVYYVYKNNIWPYSINVTNYQTPILKVYELELNKDESINVVKNNVDNCIYTLLHYKSIEKQPEIFPDQIFSPQEDNVIRQMSLIFINGWYISTYMALKNNEELVDKDYYNHYIKAIIYQINKEAKHEIISF